MGRAKTEPALVINERAIGTDQDKKFVFVVGEDNKATYREVKLGAASDGLRVVTRGLKDGERVVVNGLQRVRPGAVVAPEVVPMETASAAPTDPTPRWRRAERRLIGGGHYEFFAILHRPRSLRACCRCSSSSPPAGAARHAGFRVPGGRAAAGHRARAISRRQPQGHRRHRATPIEEQINGVEDMLYMSSQATTDGVMTLTVTFKLGTDPDKATQLVQNRVAQAEPRLPEEVRSLGITTAKSSPNFIMVVHLVSPNDRYDITYLRNYAVLNVKDRLARISGVGQIEIFGAGDYSMRVWLDPQKIAEHGPLRRRRGERDPRPERAGRRRHCRRLARHARVDLQLSVNAQAVWRPKKSSATSS